MTSKYTPEQAIISFWSKIIITADDNKCWLWIASCDRDGYGHFWYNGRLEISHRFAWSYPDYVIPDGMIVCHSCDNPKCCNPKHLFIGTNQDNTTDMKNKGRSPDNYGEKNPRCVLTAEQVAEARQKYSPQKRNRSALAREYGVSTSQMGRIVRYEQWKENEDGHN